MLKRKAHSLPQCGSDNSIVCDSSVKLDETTFLVAMAVKQHCNTNKLA